MGVHLRDFSRLTIPPVACETGKISRMRLHWFGSATAAERINFGSLAVIAPILQRMDLAGILQRHLPADPQAEFSPASVLSLLVAARLANPVALTNVADWAHHSG